VCGISIVRDYYRRLKFNVMEIANARNGQKFFEGAEARFRGRKMDEI
jgi:hypothetical protein